MLHLNVSNNLLKRRVSWLGHSFCMTSCDFMDATIVHQMAPRRLEFDFTDRGLESSI